MLCLPPPTHTLACTHTLYLQPMLSGFYISLKMDTSKTSAGRVTWSDHYDWSIAVLNTTPSCDSAGHLSLRWWGGGCLLTHLQFLSHVSGSHAPASSFPSPLYSLLPGDRHGSDRPAAACRHVKCVSGKFYP